MRMVKSLDGRVRKRRLKDGLHSRKYFGDQWVMNVSSVWWTREGMLILVCTQLLFVFYQKVILGDFWNPFGAKTNNSQKLEKCFSRPVGRASLAWAGVGGMQRVRVSILWLHSGCTKQPSLLHSNIERWFHQYKERHFEVLNAFNAIHTCAIAYIASHSCNVTKIKLKMLILWIFPRLNGRFSAKVKYGKLKLDGWQNILP